MTRTFVSVTAGRSRGMIGSIAGLLSSIHPQASRVIVNFPALFYLKNYKTVRVSDLRDATLLEIVMLEAECSKLGVTL